MPGGGGLRKHGHTSAGDGGTITTSGAPDTADYLVGTTQAGLSAEIVVGATPGGELGGTWSSPTVDATHAGTTHSAATDTHIADASDAHDASAVSLLDTATLFSATDVEAAIAELAAKDIGYQAHGNMGSTETFSAATGWHSGTFNADCTFTLSGATSGIAASMILELLEDGTGTWTPTWPGSVVWSGGVAPTHNQTAGTTTIYLLQSRDGGTTWYGFQGGSGIDFGEDADITTLDYDDVADAGSTGEVADAGHRHGMPAAGGVADILDLTTAETDDTLVLAPDGAGGVEFRAETGGSGTDVKRTFRRKNSGGNYTLNSVGSWADVDTGEDLTIAAASGDVLMITVAARYGNEAVNAFLDVATIVSASPVNYVSGGAAAAGDFGVEGWLGLSGIQQAFGPSVWYTVQAGDISGGNVVLRLRYRTSGASKTLVYGGNTNGAAFFGAVNFRQ